jgi:polysaccharide biosynthesis/export protein
MKRVIAGIVIGLTMVSTAIAQTSNGEKIYRLKPEDVLTIQVFGQQQISAQVPVGEDGYIAAPFVGTLKVQGKTLNEVEVELHKLYSSKLKLRDPIISVTIAAYRRLKANITGIVQRSAELVFRPGDTIMTLYSAGGGAIPDAADLRRATLRRQGSKELIPIDMFAMTVFGDNSQNYDLEDGDILDIPQEQKNRVLVMGAIRNPGLFPYRETMRLGDAIAIAGGEIRYLSRFSKCFVLRELPGRPGEYLRINADFVKFIKGGDFTQNVKLMPGDLVYIPETNTPDVTQLQALVNSAFVLNTFGSFFGLRIFGN